MLAGERGDTSRTTTPRRCLSTWFWSDRPIVVVVVGNFIVRRIGRQRWSTSRQGAGETTRRRPSTWQRARGREAGRTESLPSPQSPSLTRSGTASSRRSRCSRAPHWQTAPSIRLPQSRTYSVAAYIAYITFTN